MVPFFREMTLSTPRAVATKFRNFYWGTKKINPLSFRCKKIRHDERIPNLVLKVKSDEPIPLFRLSTRHPHPPTPHVIRAWWTSSIGKEADIESSPGSWRPPLAGGIRSSCLMRWWLTFWPGRFRPGDVHFSQDHYHPRPLSHIP